MSNNSQNEFVLKKVDSLTLKADSLYQVGDLIYAQVLYGMLYKFDSLNGKYNLRLGDCNSDMLIINDAIIYYNKAIVANYKLPDAYLGLTYCYALLVDTTKANYYAKKCIDADKNYSSKVDSLNKVFQTDDFESSKILVQLAITGTLKIRNKVVKFGDI
jgi:tetratricopeptide (TPR) repeat protein